MCDANILDQPEEIKRIDKSDMLGNLVKTPRYCEDAVERAKKIGIPNRVNVSEEISIKYKKPQHIVVAGMGGSAIGGEILQDWLREDLPIPIEVCRDYNLPAYANQNTLVFAVSYSGNTEETLNAFVDAINRKCMTVAITSGGRMLSFIEKIGIPHVPIPSELPPRAAIPYVFFPLPIILERVSVLPNREGEVREAIQVLKKLNKENSPEEQAKINLSKRLALELMETIPVVYGFRQYGAIAHRLKAQFNENSKVPSKYEVFPELNHNEVVGWEAPENLTKKFSVILLRDHDEPPEIRHRIEATRLLALHKTRKVLEIYARGKKKLAKMLSMMYLGDFASTYLAILQNTDPTPVKTISEIKIEMSKKLDMAKRLEAQIEELGGDFR